MSYVKSLLVDADAAAAPARAKEKLVAAAGPARLSGPARRSLALRIRRQRRQGAARTWWCFRAPPKTWSRSSRSAASTACRSWAAARAPGLSGGAIARAGGIIIGFARMNRILEIDLENERAVVQPGVVNLDITLAVRAARLLLRARSFEPARLHHRRQRGRERRRSAHAGLRRHHQSRAGSRGRAAGRHRVYDRRQGTRSSRATI